ncbi:MAG: hypothetical protein WC700_18340 [Gemmatimonadaceae bacterium]|jgi:hypothetical protein
MTPSTRTQVNMILNAILDTLAEGTPIPASYPGLAAEQSGIPPEVGRTALTLAVECGICNRSNDLLTPGPRFADILAAKRAATT